MTIEIIGGIQLFQLLGFIITALFLYRLLVKQKEALISLQESRIADLTEKITNLGRDPLAENLQSRIEIYEKELSNIKNDKALNSKHVKEKTDELERLISIQESMRTHLAHTSGMASSHFCPHCQEPTLTYMESNTDFGKNAKSNHLAKYSCGYEEHNKKEQAPCKNYS